MHGALLLAVGGPFVAALAGCLLGRLMHGCLMLPHLRPRPWRKGD